MSHRALDDIVELRRRLNALDVSIATAKAEIVVDIRAMIDMKRRRNEIIADLARQEASIT